MSNFCRRFLLCAFAVAPALAFVALPLAARAGTITPVTSFSAFNDSVNWGQLGACNQSVASTFTATSANGLTVTGSEATGHVMEDIQSTPPARGCSYDGWFGNFTPGENLLYTGTDYNDGNGPIAVSFSSAVQAVGVQIDSSFGPGSFTAQIAMYDGSNLLGTVSATGLTNGNADGSAPLLAGEDTSQADITSAVISLTTPASGGLPGDFAIGTLYLSAGPSTTTPEPSSMALLCGGLLVLGLSLRRRGLLA